MRTFNDKVSPELSEAVAHMCAKRREDRLASPKAVIETFARLGYAAPVSGETEFAAEAEAASEGMVQDLIPDLNAVPQVDDGLELETQDRDVQEVLARLRRKRMRRRVVWAGGVCILLLLAALVWRMLT